MPCCVVGCVEARSFEHAVPQAWLIDRVDGDHAVVGTLAPVTDRPTTSTGPPWVEYDHVAIADSPVSRHDLLLE